MAKLNDQSDRLIRQIEQTIERAESARADRNVPNEHDTVRGIPKPGEDWFLFSSSSGRVDSFTGGPARHPASNDDPAARRGVRSERALGNEEDPIASRRSFASSNASSNPQPTTSSRRAYPAGAFRDDFSEFDDAMRTGRREHQTSEVLADEAYRIGVDRLDAGDVENALAHFQRAKSACPRNRPAALAKIDKKIERARETLWGRSRREPAEEVDAPGGGCV